MPRISVIIPIFKAEEHLRSCIDSIRRQTFEDWELILIDDGSPDNSGAICNEYAKSDNRINVYHIENGGPSHARNIGIEKAKGEYIAFVDADDYLSSDTLEYYYEAITRHHADIVKAGYYEEWKNGERLVWKESQEYVYSQAIDFFRKTEENEYLSYTWNALVKRTVIGNIRFDEQVRFLEDHAFMYQCYLHAKKFVVLPAPKYHYRKDTGTLSWNRHPEVTLKGAELAYYWQQQIIKGRDAKLQHNTEIFYLYMLLEAIDTLYQQTITTYRERVAFCKRINWTTSKPMGWHAQLFKNRLIPFFLKDFILRITHHHHTKHYAD